VHQDSTDYESELVGVALMVIAWDQALLNLLPEGVRGIFAVLKNNCNQTHTYEIDGSDAFYRGEGDLHQGYDSMEVEVDLAIHTHPDFAATPGHCQYSLVRIQI
jgi:hypothetical protein